MPDFYPGKQFIHSIKAYKANISISWCLKMGQSYFCFLNLIQEEKPFKKGQVFSEMQPVYRIRQT